MGGLVDTGSSDNKTTDSAAAATAYSAGVRTYNGAIGVGPDKQPVQNVLERAEDGARELGRHVLLHTHVGVQHDGLRQELRGARPRHHRQHIAQQQNRCHADQQVAVEGHQLADGQPFANDAGRFDLALGVVPVAGLLLNVARRAVTSPRVTGKRSHGRSAT